MSCRLRAPRKSNEAADHRGDNVAVGRGKALAKDAIDFVASELQSGDRIGGHIEFILQSLVFASTTLGVAPLSAAC
jgi:hypothetical protein